jgi:hypothetical protein
MEGMWKEAVVGYLEALTRNLLRGTKENHEKHLQVQPNMGSRFEHRNSGIRSRIANHSTMTFGVSGKDQEERFGGTYCFHLQISARYM